jgi:hypothetical protein
VPVRRRAGVRRPDDPPLRLVLGSDAIGNVEHRLSMLANELEAWRSLGEATAIDDA